LLSRGIGHLASGLLVAALAVIRYLALAVFSLLRRIGLLGWSGLRLTASHGIPLATGLGSRTIAYCQAGLIRGCFWITEHVRGIRVSEVRRRLLATYRQLPEWGQPIVWGLLASIPFVIAIIAIRMAL
jgi:hypothetical protein